jgi:hypothetical protein
MIANGSYKFRPDLIFKVSAALACQHTVPERCLANNLRMDFMRFILPALIAVSLVSACGGGGARKPSPEQIAQINAARANAKTVEVDGKTFSVTHVTEKSYALVRLEGEKASYYTADLEAAAHAATTCEATFKPGALAFIIQDITSADLSKIGSDGSGPPDGWPVKLSC